MLYKLYNEQHDILKWCLAKYIKVAVIASAEEAKDVDYENTGNHPSDNDVFIGIQARIYIAEHEDDLSGSSSIQIVYKATTVKLRAR